MALPVIPRGEPSRDAPTNPDWSWSSQFLRGFGRGLASRRHRQALLEAAELLDYARGEPSEALRKVAAANEPFRGPRRVDRRSSGGKSLGQIKTEEARARARARTLPRKRSSAEARASILTVRIPGIRAGAVARGAAANPVVPWLYEQAGRLGVESGQRRYYRRQLGGPILNRGPVSRGRAAPSRPLSTGPIVAGSTIPGPIPGTARPAPAPAASPRAPEGLPGGRPGGLNAPPGRNPAPAPRTSPGASPVPRTTTGHAPDLLRFQLPDLGALLARALAPRAVPRAVTAARGTQIVRPLPTTLGTPFSPAPSPGLTPSNSPLLGFSQATQPQPVPHEALDRCKCPPKKKRETKERCRNPVISRTRSGDVQTTKVRLVCQPSKPKPQLQRVLRTLTS